jgi:hypothetical protein
MKTKILLALIISPLVIRHSALGQGALTPPGAPAPTMKSLDQIEARTPISSAPVHITQPGSYYLTTNLTVSSGDAIDINTNGVTLDLNGFTIASTAPSADGFAINLGAAGRQRNIAILDGFIVGGVTNDNAGNYGGGGFSYGIAYPGVNFPRNVRVSHVAVSGCLADGINLRDLSTTVEFCTVTTVGGYGIFAETVSDSTVADSGGFAAINASQTANNCSANNIATGAGLNTYAAHNCYGNATGGDGVSAITASDCVGSSTDYNGLSTVTALNCEGESFNGTGLAATIAVGCSGFSFYGIGLSAVTANSCHGTTTAGMAQSITNKYNMP